MSDSLPLPELMARTRAGDELAGSELCRRFTPCLHRHIHFRLLRSSLRRHCDTTEILDSVWRRFFVRIKSLSWRAEWDQDEKTLQRLLLQMADDNLAAKARRRGNQQVSLPDHAELADDAPDPVDVAAATELVGKTRAHCTDLEWELLVQFAEGSSYVDIARASQSSPDAVRMRLKRLLKRLRGIL